MRRRIVYALALLALAAAACKDGTDTAHAASVASCDRDHSGELVLVTTSSGQWAFTCERDANGVLVWNVRALNAEHAR